MKFNEILSSYSGVDIQLYKECQNTKSEGVLLRLNTSGKHLHDRIISLRVRLWVHNNRLTWLLVIEMPVPSQTGR